jgi:hypothetical protein
MNTMRAEEVNQWPQRVADDEAGPVDKIAEYFGLVIAYLLPGLVGLWGASYWSPNVRQWMTTAGTSSTSFGGFLFLMVAAIGAGVVLHTFRWLVFEKMLPAVCRESFCERWMLNRPSYAEGTSRSPAIQTQLVSLRDEHYRYYQCHGGLALGLPVVFVLWFLFGNSYDTFKATAAGISTAVFACVSFFAALDAQRRMRMKRLAILGERSEMSNGSENYNKNRGEGSEKTIRDNSEKPVRSTPPPPPPKPQPPKK